MAESRGGREKNLVSTLVRASSSARFLTRTWSIQSCPELAFFSFSIPVPRRSSLGLPRQRARAVSWPVNSITRYTVTKYFLKIISFFPEARSAIELLGDRCLANLETPLKVVFIEYPVAIDSVSFSTKPLKSISPSDVINSFAKM